MIKHIENSIHNLRSAIDTLEASQYKSDPDIEEDCMRIRLSLLLDQLKYLARKVEKVCDAWNWDSLKKLCITWSNILL